MEKVGCSLIQLMMVAALIFGVEATRRRLGPTHAADTTQPTPAATAVPVTQDAVDLYLGVMRATAERVRHPTPEDLATVAAFERIRNASSSPTSKLTREERQIIQRTVLLSSALDEVVAQEKRLDLDRYRAAKAAVESVLPVPDGKRHLTSGVLTAAESRALNSRGSVLAPWVREIRELQTFVFVNSSRQAPAMHSNRTPAALPNLEGLRPPHRQAL